MDKGAKDRGKNIMESNKLIKEAKKLAVSCGQACTGDVDLLVRVAKQLCNRPFVVELGAQSGIMPLAVFGVRPDAFVATVDHRAESFNWEAEALRYYGCNNWKPIVDKSVAASEYMKRPIDLLIIDADHSYKGVLADLKAYKKLMNNPSYIFLHDYDGRTAPYQYPGVAKAAKEFFKRKWTYKKGWSAAWNIQK